MYTRTGGVDRTPPAQRPTAPSNVDHRAQPDSTASSAESSAPTIRAGCHRARRRLRVAATVGSDAELVAFRVGERGPVVRALARLVQNGRAACHELVDQRRAVISRAA